MISQDMGDSRTCIVWVRLLSFMVVFRVGPLGSVPWGRSLGCSGGLVVAGGVDEEFAQQFAGGGVDDADVEVLDEQDDVGSGVGSADADVMQLAVDSQRDAAGVIDSVGAD